MDLEDKISVLHLCLIFCDIPAYPWDAPGGGPSILLFAEMWGSLDAHGLVIRPGHILSFGPHMQHAWFP